MSKIRNSTKSSMTMSARITPTVPIAFLNAIEAKARAADVRVTRQLREAAGIIDIPLLDHVIVGTPTEDPIRVGHYSFRDAGVL